MDKIFYRNEQNGNEIKPFLDTLNKLKKEDFKINIPGFQRPYSWNEEKLDAFLSDIEDTFKEKSKNYFDNEKSYTYFIGNIYYSDNLSSNADEIDILDGQQRIITMYLIALSIYEKILGYKKNKIYKIINNNYFQSESYLLRAHSKRIFKENFIESTYNEIQNFLFLNESKSEIPINPNPKINLSRTNDNDAFFYIIKKVLRISWEKNLEIEKTTLYKNWIEIQKWINKFDDDFDVYFNGSKTGFFEKDFYSNFFKIEYIEKDYEQDSELNIQDFENSIINKTLFFLKFFEVIFKKSLTLGSLFIKSFNDAPGIFMNINSKGQNLTNFDIIRADLISILGEKSEAHEDTFNQIERNLKDCYKGKDKFLLIFLKSFYLREIYDKSKFLNKSKTITASNLYEKYKLLIKVEGDKKPINEAASFIKNMLDCSILYKKYIFKEKKYEFDLSNPIDKILFFKYKQLFPLIIACLKKMENKEALNLIDLSFKYMNNELVFMGTNANKIWPTTLEIIRNLDNEETLKSLKLKIKNSLDYIKERILFDENKFNYDATKPKKDFSQQMKFFIVSIKGFLQKKINNINVDKGNDFFKIRNDWELEFILPESVSKWFQNKYWDNKEKKDYEHFVPFIGNVCLLPYKMHKSIKNNLFEEKMKDIQWKPITLDLEEKINEMNNLSIKSIYENSKKWDSEVIKWRTRVFFEILINNIGIFNYD